MPHKPKFQWAHGKMVSSFNKSPLGTTTGQSSSQLHHRHVGCFFKIDISRPLPACFDLGGLLWGSRLDLFKSFPNLTFHQLWKLLHDTFTPYPVELHALLCFFNKIRFKVLLELGGARLKTENTFHFSSSHELLWLKETYNCQVQEHLEIKEVVIIKISTCRQYILLKK